MGQAKRLRQIGMPTREEINDGFLAIRDEGQGVWTFEVIHADQLPELVCRGFTDEAAEKLVYLIAQFLEKLWHAKLPGLCLLCDYEFVRALPPPAMFVVLRARIDSPTVAMLNGLCRECAGHVDLADRIVRKYRESVISDIRVIPEPSAPGHA